MFQRLLLRSATAIGIAVLGVVLPSVVTTSQAHAEPRAVVATSPQPGQCYLHGIAEIDAVSPPVPPVDCARKHTVEVWRVARWSVPSYPWDLSEDRQRAIAKRACKLSTFPKGDFNFWAYFLPTKRQWRAGERWIRCDAMVVDMDSSGQIETVYWWRGRAI